MKNDEWNNVLKNLSKAEKLYFKAGNKAKLGVIYNSIAEIYFHQDNMDESLKYNFKAEKIRIEIRDYSGLVSTYYNIGMAYIKKKEKSMGESFIILAGYLALVFGLKSERIRIEWKLLPIRAKLGEDKFLYRGIKLIKSRGIMSVVTDDLTT